MQNIKNVFIIFSVSGLLTACTVGPNYVRPDAPVPPKYKEAKKNWKIANPADAYNRGSWWETFHDQQLNELENELNLHNQSVIQAEAQYRQARALVDEACASLFPVLTADASLTRQKQVAGSADFTSTSTSGAISTGSATTGIGGSNAIYSTNHTLAFDASWEPDIWGIARRNVEANVEGAQASNAVLASTRLSSQASLAQYYFEMRSLDEDQRILDNTVTQYKKALQLTQNRYNAGIAARVDVVQAQSQLESAQALAINNHISRDQFEHAIAVLIGVPPTGLTIKPKPLTTQPPPIPLEVPSVLLERRPDIAQAERLMAQANAQIGVAIGAYFPTLTLTAVSSVTNPGLSNWFSLPAMSWALGGDLAETILDGGLRRATINAARANYDATVANYRQVVLSAFQDVEDNLVSLRMLKQQVVVQKKAAVSAEKSLELITNQYKSGIVDYTAVITAQNTAYTAEKDAADIIGQEMVSAVGLIKAMGGGWDEASLRLIAHN